MPSTDRRTTTGRTAARCSCGRTFSGQAGLGLHMKRAHPRPLKVGDRVRVKDHTKEFGYPLRHGMVGTIGGVTKTVKGAPLYVVVFSEHLAESYYRVELHALPRKRTR